MRQIYIRGGNSIHRQESQIESQGRQQGHATEIKYRQRRHAAGETVNDSRINGLTSLKVDNNQQGIQRRGKRTENAGPLAARQRRELAGAAGHLVPGGRLMVEIGPTQGPAVAGLFQAAGLRDLQVRPDLDGRDRVVIALA